MIIRCLDVETTGLDPAKEFFGRDYVSASGKAAGEFRRPGQTEK
jgi:hypothetical protein